MSYRAGFSLQGSILVKMVSGISSSGITLAEAPTPFNDILQGSNQTDTKGASHGHLWD